MPYRYLAAIALVVLQFGFAAGSQAAAGEPLVDKCLAASFYPDGSDLYRDCAAAIQLKGLDRSTAAKINLQLGQAIYFAHRPGMALPYLDAALKDDESLDQAWRRRGWAHLMLNHDTEAMADFTSFLELRPDDPDALFAVTMARSKISKNCATTIPDFERILDRHPDHYLTRFVLAAKYHCADGNHVRQLEQLDLIVAAGREKTSGVIYYDRQGAADYDFYARVRTERYDVYHDMRRLDGALEEMNWLVAAYPAIPEGLIRRSLVQTDRGNYVDALRDAEVALELSPGHPYAQTAKLEALQRLDRSDEIVDYASAILRSGYVTPRTAAVHFMRGAAYKHLGLKDEAIRDLTTAMAMDEAWVWAVQTQLYQAGYLFGPRKFRDRDPVPDFTAKPFVNALAACMIDPECFQR